jgi:hypothetical protein
VWRAQAICSFNQAAVLIVLISLAVMKAPHDPQGMAGFGMLVALAGVKACQLAPFLAPRGKSAPISFGFQNSSSS